MNPSNTFQVSIIGGGIAGLTLAIQLADAGYSSIVFEKNKYPFHKVCGEYVSMESWNFLERLGLKLSEMKLPHIKKLIISSPSGKALHHQLDLGGFGISRYLLDSKLAETAIKKGVVLLEDCKVSDVKFDGKQFTVETSKGNFISEIAVGAWGKKSNLDTKLVRAFTLKDKTENNYVGIKYHINIDFPDDLIELHNFENGYCGISKIEDGKHCLCYICDSENLKKYNGDIKKMEKEVLMKNPFLKKYFTEATFLFDEPLAISQIKIGYKNAIENNILMLGDSAGNIAPLSGNGMSMAMRSSFVLNGLLNEYFNELPRGRASRYQLKDFFNSEAEPRGINRQPNKKITRIELETKYQLFWKSEFKQRVEFSKLLQKLLKNKSLTNFAISVLKRFSFLRNAVVKSTHGKPF